MSSAKIIGKKHYKQYTLKQVIGSGSFGKVYASPPYAVKEMVVVGLSAFLLNSLKNQIEILSKIDHPNVVKLVDHFYQGNYVYLVMEYCEQDLCKYLKNNRCDEKTALSIFKQLVLGFRELVKMGIIHRDLKPANILVNSKNQFKLADFGFAKFVDHYDSKLLYSIVGTPLYMSPQILSKTHYTTKSDIWSLGFILYEMLTGTYPWMGVSQADLYKNITTRPLQIPSSISLYSRDLLTRMLKVNEKQRISWQQLFNLTLNNRIPSPQKQRPRVSRQNIPMNYGNKQNESPTRRRVFQQTPLKGLGIKQKNQQIQNKQKIISQQKQKKQDLNIALPIQVLKEIFLAEIERMFGEQESKIIEQTPYSSLNRKQIQKFQTALQLFNQDFKKAVKVTFKGGLS